MELCNEKLRKIRMSANLTQEQMADKIGMSYPHYNRLESGKRKIKMEHIKGIANTLGKEEKEVFQTLSNSATVSNTINNPHNNQNVVNINEVATWERLLAAKEEIIQQKEEIIQQKDRIIALLESQLKLLTELPT